MDITTDLKKSLTAVIKQADERDLTILLSVVHAMLNTPVTASEFGGNDGFVGDEDSSTFVSGGDAGFDDGTTCNETEDFSEQGALEDPFADDNVDAFADDNVDAFADDTVDAFADDNVDDGFGTDFPEEVDNDDEQVDPNSDEPLGIDYATMRGVELRRVALLNWGVDLGAMFGKIKDASKRVVAYRKWLESADGAYSTFTGMGFEKLKGIVIKNKVQVKFTPKSTVEDRVGVMAVALHVAGVRP